MDLLDKIENLKIGYSIPGKVYKMKIKDKTIYFHYVRRNIKKSNYCYECYFYNITPILVDCINNSSCIRTDYIYKEISEIEALVLSDSKKRIL